MRPTSTVGFALTAALWFAPAVSFGQTRTRWEMNPGSGIAVYSSPSPMYGDPSEYAYSRIPAADDPSWGPAPDPDRIQYDVRSTLCDAMVACLAGGEFTYFRAVMCIPDPRDIATAAVRIGSVDDGARVTIFNSTHPSGFTPSNGYSNLGGGTVTSGDFAGALRVGERNVLVVTHVDDCCQQSYLMDTVLLVNGEPLPATVPRETCNGLDDDCNGSIDDGLGQTSCGTGGCLRTVDNCISGRIQTCSPALPSTEICDGIDNDCNGIVDDVVGGCDAGRSDVVADGPYACTSVECRRSLRLEGRAGPLGNCACSTPGCTSVGWSFPCGGWLAAAAWMLRARTRRRRPARIAMHGYLRS